MYLSIIKQLNNVRINVNLNSLGCAGRLKMRVWKMRYGHKCKGGKCGSGKCGSRSQG